MDGLILFACFAVGVIGFAFALLNGDAVGKAMRFVAAAAFVGGCVFTFIVNTDVGVLCSIILMVIAAILLVLAEIWRHVEKIAERAKSGG